MILNKHIDKRGLFQELYKSNGDFVAHQISFILINPGEIRGGHYHKYLIEKFILLSGSVEIRQENVVTNFVYSSIYMNEKLDQFETTPYVNHSFYSENGCEMLILASKVFDPEDTDTYKD